MAIPCGIIMGDPTRPVHIITPRPKPLNEAGRCLSRRELVAILQRRAATDPRILEEQDSEQEQYEEWLHAEREALR
jgi:hypothetical protein